MSEIVRPADLTAEAAVIGSILLDVSQVGQCANLSPEDFCHTQYAMAWQAIQELLRDGKPLDMVMVSARMAQLSPSLPSDEAYSVLLEATNGVLTANVEHYVGIVHAKSQQWRLIQLLRQAGQMVLRQEAHVTAQRLMQSLAGMLAQDTSMNGVKPYHVALSEYIDTLEDYINRPEMMLRTGFGDLDNALGGVRGGDLIYIAGRPSMGKSSFAKPIGRRNAARFKRLGKGSVLHISLEVPAADITESHIANRFAPPLDTRYMRAGLRLDNGEVDEVTHQEILYWAAIEDEETHGHYFLVDNPNTTTADVERYILQTPDVGMVIVDQFNLLKDRVKGDDEFHRLSEISHRLKAIALRHNVPLFCCTQIKRDVEDRANRRPTMADLRGTGDQEQDADIVLGIYRPEYHFKVDASDGEVHPAYDRFAELLILKNRKGKAGGDMVPLYWNAESAQYTDWPHDIYPLGIMLECARRIENKGTPHKRGKAA